MIYQTKDVSVFEQCKKFIKDSIRRSKSFFTYEDLKKQMEDGHITLLIKVDNDEIIGCVLLRPVSAAWGIPAMGIVAMGGFSGFMKNYMKDMCQAVEATAKQQGFNRMIVQGRRAWHKFEKELGYNHLTSVFTKEI